jgi:hypothetical protein
MCFAKDFSRGKRACVIDICVPSTVIGFFERTTNPNSNAHTISCHHDMPKKKLSFVKTRTAFSATLVIALLLLVVMNLSKPFVIREFFRDSAKITYVIRSHMYTPRLQSMFREFQSAFGEDSVYVLFDITKHAAKPDFAEFQDKCVTVSEIECSKINHLHEDIWKNVLQPCQVEMSTHSVSNFCIMVFQCIQMDSERRPCEYMRTSEVYEKQRKSHVWQKVQFNAGKHV